MPSLKDLRLRIKSVKNTQQITKTMKTVAAAKMVRAREACENARPYTDRLGQVIAGLNANLSGQDAPLLLQGREEVKTVRLIAFGSDRGLCGGMNTNLARRAEQLIKAWEAEGKQVQIVTVGRKINDLLKSGNREKIVQSYNDMMKEISYTLAAQIGARMVEDFEAELCDEVFILYSFSLNVMKQDPTLRSIIPFKAEENITTTDAAREYEPSESAILDVILPKNVNQQILSAMLETYSSEQGARMTAMDSATRNAGDMIKRLTVDYNRSRQAQITKELIEIISGAEAV